jgi:ribosomal protein S18 acetylase RimI-like enzyme
MLRLRTFRPVDDLELIRWVPDAATLRLFAGQTLTWPLDPPQLEALRGDARVLAWTAWAPEAGGAPEVAVGHAELVRTDPQRIVLARVIVAPEHRGRGFGRQLVEAVLAEASRRGASRVALNVLRDNVAAMRLYRAVGFEPVAGVVQRDGRVRMARNLD